MVRKILIILTLFATLAVQAEEQTKDQIDKEINALHGRFISAFENYEPDTYLSTYDKDGIYLRSGDADMLKGHEALGKHYQKPEEGSPRRELSIRVVDRVYSDKLVSDVAWFRVLTFDENDKQVSEFYGRVLLVSAPQADGTWAYIHDMGTGANKDLWDSAKPVPGLHFDK